MDDEDDAHAQLQQQEQAHGQLSPQNFHGEDGGEREAGDEQQLDERILKDFKLFQNKQLKNSLDKLLLRGLIPVVIDKRRLKTAIRTSTDVFA